MEQLEAESVLFRGPLDQLAGAEDNGSDPVARLQGKVYGFKYYGKIFSGSSLFGGSLSY